VNVAKNLIKLSKGQVEYLRHSSFLAESLAQIIDAVDGEGIDERVIHISREVAEEFRAAFTHQLAKVGFHPDYEPTQEGRILEELIDCFYLGSEK
jgi:hypothetical protein